MSLWTWIRGVGGNREEEAALKEELGREDLGEAEERYVAEAGYGEGLAVGEAAEVADADLDEFKPPRDPSP
ncbi:MAG: hypothetical protein E6F94_11405 [Actinobacteria bacterium]|nr:MAG: hypothetical protein E6G38_07020 [Actinomycetota bacterium]TMM23433.1 MAG: hypothetical protein E6F94_11405 [Actinomycetota bacterium]